MALRPGTALIKVARVTLPVYLKTQDVRVRRGSIFETSHTGRCASRLSLGGTARLARTRRYALVTDQRQALPT